MTAQRDLTTEARYRTLFERAPIGIVYADASSVYLDANDAICRMLGYARDELIGLSASDIIAPAEAGGIGDALREIHDDGDHQREWTFRRKDGTTFVAEVVATKFDDGTLLGMIRDISDIRAQRSEVRRVNRLFTALSRVNQAIIFAESREELFERVCRILVEDGGLRMAWVGWLDVVTGEVRPVASFGDEQGVLPSFRITAGDEPDGMGPVGRAIRAGAPHVVSDFRLEAERTPRHAELAARGFRSSIAVPIKLDGKPEGALNVLSESVNAFRAKEIGLLIEVATNLSYALDTYAREEARLAAERTLRAEQRFSETIIESMPGILYLYDTDGRFLRWNRNFEAVSGLSPEEMAVAHPSQFFAEEDRARVSARIAEVFTAGASAVEADFVAKDGTRTPYYFTGRRVDFAGRACLVGVGIDVSELHRAQVRLLESEAHLLEAQRIARLGSWQFDLASGRLSWSEQIHEILGLSRARFEPTVEGFLAMVHPADRERLQRAVDDVSAGHGRLDVEHRVTLPDGSERVVHQQGALQRDGAGAPVAIAGTLHDITDRVRMMEEREQRHRAEAADRIKSAFLATMSHELRTPLNSIIGFTGILVQGLAGPLNAEQQKQLEMVRGSARHLLALVNDVLDISKIEAGQLEVAREPVDVAVAVRRVCEGVRPQADAKGLALELAAADGLGTLRSDARRFEQILLNLLSNAIKFTDHGRVRVRAELVAPSGRPDDYAQGGVRVSVQDTGIGIRREELDHLFQPFRQVDGGLSRAHEGTGLGLAICRRLAHLMGGEVTVESTWGVGSTFTITLPRQWGA